MKVEGTTVALVDLPGAVALEFSTTGDMAELRRRVAAMAEHHRSHQAKPAEGGGPMHPPAPSHEAASHRGDHAAHGHGHRMMVPAKVGVEDTATGARLVFTPEQATDLASLREHLDKHSKHMAEGRCGMMAAPEGDSSAPTPQPTATAH